MIPIRNHTNCKRMPPNNSASGFVGAEVEFAVGASGGIGAGVRRRLGGGDVRRRGGASVDTLVQQ